MFCRLRATNWLRQPTLSSEYQRLLCLVNGASAVSRARLCCDGQHCSACCCDSVRRFRTEKELAAPLVIGNGNVDEAVYTMAHSALSHAVILLAAASVMARHKLLKQPRHEGFCVCRRLLRWWQSIRCGASAQGPSRYHDAGDAVDATLST